LYPTLFSLFEQSLVPPPNNPPQGQASDTIQVLKSVPPLPKTLGDNGRPSSLPEKPPAARRIIRTRPPDQFVEPHFRGTMSTPTKHPLPQQDSPRSPKRRKEGADEDSGPSLLSRLGTSLSTAHAGSAPRANSTANPTPRSNSAAQNPPEFGYSIKGAAKIAARTQPDFQPSMETPSFSLLDRLEDGSSNQPDDRASGSWKKKKRGRMY
jgi:hypothetical protein